jgi:hypothetical protein
MKGDGMIKTITLEWLQSEGACKESLEAWQKETDHDTFATLNRLLDKNPEWGNWLACRLMNKNQAVQYAIFAAEQVIDIYERKYPNDKRPRNAIEAAKAYLENPSRKTKASAAAAAYERRKMKAKILKYGIGLLEQSCPV